MRNIANSWVSSPFPEVLFDIECTALLTIASSDPRTYLLFVLLLEAGLKLEELFALEVWHFDFSNKYAPEIHVKHTGKKEKKSRKLKLPVEIIPVFNDYVAAYKVDDVLFPYTLRFISYLITETAEKAGVKKKVSTQILGSVLRLSLPPKNGCEQPIPSDPDMIRQSRRHRWRTMMDSGLILDSQTAMGSAKVVLHHREPTHPAMISARLGKRQGLSQG